MSWPLWPAVTTQIDGFSPDSESLLADYETYFSKALAT
jgi:hypothetical protein